MPEADDFVLVDDWLAVADFDLFELQPKSGSISENINNNEKTT
ncbi:MAG TPA: hypothetical protein VEH58_06865 [Dehalococcoidales bacterium]|nr:hypothetical protein [Dehalococcoidales bacterium]